MSLPTHYTFFDHFTFQIQESFQFDDLQATARHAMNLRVAALFALVVTGVALLACGSVLAGSFAATYGMSSLLLLPITLLLMGMNDTYRLLRCFHNYAWSADRQRTQHDQVKENIENIYDWVKENNKPDWYTNLKWHVDSSIFLPIFAYLSHGRMRN
jgi:hypothetical protein